MKRLLIFTIICTAISTAFAQTNNDSTVILENKANEKPMPKKAANGIHSFVGKDNVNLADSAQMYGTLLNNTPFENEFKFSPKFAIVGLDGQFFFSTGARMKFTASYDWNNPIKHPTELLPSKLSQALPGNEHLFQMSAGGSSIYFNIIGFPNSQNQVGLFINLGLDAENNNSYRLKAKNIYMRYRGILCGYNKSMYHDPEAEPYSIHDGEVASGDHSSVQINYQRAIGKRFSFGVGIELPSTSYTLPIYEGTTKDQVVAAMKNEYQRGPDFPRYINCSWGDKGHIRLSTVIRNITSYGIKSHTYVTGYGLKLSGHVQFKPFTIYGKVHGGRAIANYMTSDDGIGLDIVPSEELIVVPGEVYNGLKPTYSLGFIGGVQCNFSRKVFASANYSYIRNYIDPYTCAATQDYKDCLRHAQHLAVNVVWKISSLFNAGIEYAYATRTLESLNSVGCNSIAAIFLMTF